MTNKILFEVGIVSRSCSTLILGISLAFFSCLLTSPNSAVAEFYEITILGEVEFNQVTNGTLGNVQAGDLAALVFWVDCDNFVDSNNFPTRAYAIENSFFILDFGGANQLGLQDPFPSGSTPYFVLRDNDPAVDGFFLSLGTDLPSGLPLTQTGQFSQFNANFSVTYDGMTLPSLDIEDAIGFYDFTGLSVFNWTVSDGPFDAMGMIFSEMRIRVAEKPCNFPLGDLNFDFEVNLLDVDPFIQAIMNGDFICEADANQDGAVNLIDVAPFVQILTAG